MIQKQHDEHHSPAGFLLYGIGNPGRRDDGLGIVFAETIQQRFPHHYIIEQNYQPNVEDALLLSTVETVLFADASRNEIDRGFRVTYLEKADTITFSTHAMTPEALLGLSDELFGCAPNARLLEIQGYDWEIGDGLSADAQRNLKKALAFFETTFR